MSGLGPVLEGKSVVITGGSMGIGFATAKACLEAGASITICSRHARDLDKALEALDGGSRAAARAADVTRVDDVDRLLDTAIARHGRLDAVVHSAGVYGPIGPAYDVDPEEWLDAIRINLFGTFLVARQAVRRFRASGGGRLVLFSGGGAASPFPRYTSYACAKAAVVRFTETLALEVAADDIAVNCIAPGFVITRLHEQTLAAAERAGSDFLATTRKQIDAGGVPPEVAADTAVFLASDLARGITGKFVAAPYDGWRDWPQHLGELRSTDIFTLRRIVPKDRGMNWQ